MYTYINISISVYMCVYACLVWPSFLFTDLYAVASYSNHRVCVDIVW